MNNAIDIETYLLRQKEVFNAYIQSSGRETSLLPFITKYSKEDKEEYNFFNIWNYILSYVSSNLISETELDLFKKTKLTTSDIIFRRGKVIVQRLIEAKGNIDDILFYIEKFSKEDEKVVPYEKSYLLKCRDFYLKKTKNSEKRDTYLKVIGLSKNSSNYTVDLLNKILEFDNLDKAIEFIKNINISKKSLLNLLETYKILYPTNKQEYEKLQKIINVAFEENKKTIKFITPVQKTNSPLERIAILKRIIEEYLISDLESIKPLFKKYQFNTYKFEEALKDAETSTDLILRNLLNKYYLKQASIKANKRTIIEKILNSYTNGINYGNGYREFNMFDYYTMSPYSIDDFLKEVRKLYDYETYIEIKEKFNKFRLSSISKNSASLVKSIGKFSKNGRILTNDELELIAEYLEYASLPLDINLFFATALRYIDGDLDLNKTDKEQNKVNKHL